MQKGLGLAVLAAVLAAGAPAAAQVPAGDQWHGSGTVGVSLEKMTQTSIIPGMTLNPVNDYNTAAGDLRLHMNGYIGNPLFLPFYLSFTGEHASNAVATTGYHDTLLGGTFSTTLLPAKPYPLRFYYSKTNFGATGNVFDQTNITSTLGLEWNLNEPKIPKLSVGFTRLGNDVIVPTSIYNTTYDQNHAYINAHDTYKQWAWYGGYDNYNSTSSLPSGILDGGSPIESYDEMLHILTAQVDRPFWGKKAEFHAENRTQWLNEGFSNQESISTTESFTGANLRIQHTPKLSSSYFYTLDRVTTPNAGPTGGAGGILLLIPPTFYSHYTGGRVDYRATKHVGLFEEIHYQHVTPASQEIEYRESLTESLSGIDLQTTWNKIDMFGEYVGHWQFMGTNFGNHNNTYSNEAHGRAAWGNPFTFRITVYGDYNMLNLVDQINGFTENHRIGAQIQTTWPRGFHWRFLAGRSYVELLNISGNVEQYGTDLQAQLDQKYFGLGYSHLLTAGNGALFPEIVGQRTTITDPLPLDQLVATPLLASTTRVDAANLVVRINRNLDLSGNLRQERDFLATSNFSYRMIQARLKYRLGKFTFEGAYGHFINDTISNNILSGLHTDQYMLRVARDFRMF
jgi:hypothetical protein